MKILIPFKQIYNFLNKYISRILVIFFVLLLILNAFVYYQYMYLVIKIDPEPVVKKTYINQETLERVLDDIYIREENLLRVQTSEYFDPFND